MRLTYFGHASFLVETADGTRVILDPYLSGAFDGAIGYRPIDEPADVVIATHTHDDHGAVETIPGNPRVLVQPTSHRVGSLQITGVASAHDEAGGSKRGRNTIVILDDGEVRLVHLGDLGHLLDAATVKAIGRVDVLLIPVGGFFTIDPAQAATVVDSLSPSIVIPMHFKTDKAAFPIVSADAFLATQETVERKGGSTLEVSQAMLPPQRVTVLLAPSR